MTRIASSSVHIQTSAHSIPGVAQLVRGSRCGCALSSARGSAHDD
jgi:hypothetical protein